MLLPKRVTTLLVNNANPILNLARRIVPDSLENQAVLYVMNRLAKEFIVQGDLDFMEGKVARVSIPDIDLHWYFTKQGTQESGNEKLALIHESNSHITPDVEFSGTLEAMVLMASQKVDPDTLFFNRQLHITGDTELGLEIKNLIDQFDIRTLHTPIQKLLDAWSSNLLQSKSALN